MTILMRPSCKTSKMAFRNYEGYVAFVVPMEFFLSLVSGYGFWVLGCLFAVGLLSLMRGQPLITGLVLLCCDRQSAPTFQRRSNNNRAVRERLGYDQRKPSPGTGGLYGLELVRIIVCAALLHWRICYAMAGLFPNLPYYSRVTPSQSASRQPPQAFLLTSPQHFYYFIPASVFNPPRN